MNRPLFRVAIIAGLLAGLIATPSVAAQGRVLLMPSVTYERQVTFTSHGPVVSHVLVAPRPGGLYSLRPALANGTIPGRETVTSIQKRVSGGATVAGVNGDLFNWADGHPTGVVMQDGVLWHRPSAERSSIGIDADGTLHVERVAMFGTWQGTGPRRTVSGVNETPPANGMSLYTPAWGPATPALPGSYEVVLSPFAPALPNIELAGVVVGTSQNGGTPIPVDGAVLVARGTQVPKLAEEAVVGGSATLRLLLQPDWGSMLHAVGGGPLIVQDGRVVFKANELFTPDQLLPRSPRTAVGQRADGKIVMLVVDGRQAGYSTGLTNFELGQTMQRLGCVAASALDSGGSSTMAFDGRLLNLPSDGAERAVKEALLVYYTGVYAPAASQPVLSPNGDGVADRQALSYKLVRPSTVTVQLVGPDGKGAYSDAGTKNAGVYKLAWPPAASKPVQGRWQWVVQAEDDQGQRSSVNRGFTVNNTLGFLRIPGPALAVPRARPRPIATATLALSATILAWVESETGAPIVNLASRRVPAGPLVLEWDGRRSNGNPVYPGRYVVKVAASNSLGRVELQAPFRIVKAKPRPKPVPKKSAG